MNNKIFLKYLAISLVSHISLALCFFVVSAFGGFAGLGNAPKSFFNILGIILMILLVILLMLQLYLLTRKILSIRKRIVISLLPFLVGVMIFRSIIPVTTKLNLQRESNSISKSKQSIQFSGTFIIKNSENNMFSHHTVTVPFEAKSDFGINRFIFAYYVGISGHALDESGLDASECPLDNNVFDAIADPQGNTYIVKEYFGDGQKLPAGNYVALKYIAVNVTENKSTYCYNKVIEDIKNGKTLNLYSANPFQKKSTKLLQNLQLVEH